MTRLALVVLLFACCQPAQPERTPPLISALAYAGRANSRSWTLDIWPDGTAVVTWFRNSRTFHVEPEAAQRIRSLVGDSCSFEGPRTYGETPDDGDRRRLVVRDGVGLALIEFGSGLQFQPLELEPEAWPQFRAALEAWCEVEALLPPIEPPPELVRLGMGHLARVADEYRELARSR